MMRIIEARDGFIKIDAEKKLAVSSFLEVNCFNKRYIAQVQKVSTFEDKFLVIAKILFLCYKNIIE